jgi:hypothetical protein
MAGELRVERNLLLPDRSPARPDVIVCQPLRVLSWQLAGGHVAADECKRTLHRCKDGIGR